MLHRCMQRLLNGRETAAMLRARSVHAQRLQVHRARIALVAVEAVLRVLRVQFAHARIARDLGQDRGGHDRAVAGVAADPRYLDISLPPRTRRHIPVESSRHAFAYVFAGSGKFRDASEPLAVRNELKDGEYDLSNRSLVLFDSGDEIVVESGDDGIRFLLVSGQPIEEPVAWYGPIVMNTQAELRQAMRELQLGTFIRET